MLRAVRTPLPSLALLLLTASAAPALAQPADGDAPAPSEVSAPESEAPAPSEPVVQSVSWDITAGGVPTSGAIAQLEAGFSGLPRAAYHYSLRRGFSVGGLVGFDYGLWRPSRTFGKNLVFAAPMRWTIFRDQAWSVGARVDPGLAFGFEGGFTLGLMANLQATAGYALENRIILGGGLELPILLAIPTRSGRSTVFAVPVLVGPVAEFHLTPPLAITMDVKVGPHIATDDVRWGLKLMAGVAYRL